MSFGVRTTDFGSHDNLRAVAVIGLSAVKYTLLNCARNGECLEYGTRFIYIGHAEIIPHIIKSIHSLLIIHLCKLLLRVIRREVIRIIEVKCRILGHRQYLSVIRVYYHDCRMLRTISLIEFPYLILYNALNIAVYREFYDIAVDCRLYRCLNIQILSDISIFSSVSSGKI